MEAVKRIVVMQDGSALAFGMGADEMSMDSHVVVPLRFLLPDNSRTAAKFAKL